MAEAPSFLCDITDDVHCSICLELFTNPQALQCLHTFCQHCIKQCIIGQKITCPTCRKQMARADIVYDFKTNKLVDLYKKQKVWTVQSTLAPSGRDVVCILCEEKTAQFFCHACSRYLCSGCQKAHLKMSVCQEEDVKKLQDLVEAVLKNLEPAAAEMIQETDNLKKHYDKIVDLTVTLREKCLQGINESEKEIITDVQQTHESKRSFVTKICDEKIREMTRRRDKQVGRAEQLMEQITNVKNSTLELMDTHQSLQQQIDEVIPQLSKQIFIPVKFNLSSKGLKAFDSNKTVLVEEDLVINGNITSRSKAEKLFVKGTGFNGQLQTLKTQPITVQKVAEIGDRVYQLQLVEDQLWALKRDRIDVLDRNGSVSQTYTPGFTDALDMCVTGLGDVIVATESSGLLQLTSRGQMLRCIDEGSHLTVTSSDQESVWAVKKEGTKLWIVKYHISVAKYEIVKFRISVMLRGPSIYCSLLGHKLYISNCSNDCIYAVDTSNGHILAKQVDERPGKLRGPRCIYSDKSSYSLLIMTTNTKQLQLLDTATNNWSAVETTGAEMEYPRTAVVDRQGQMWITAGDYNSCLLYKCAVEKTK